MKILSTVLALAALFFGGCSVLAKPAPRTNYFMLGSTEDKFKECENKPEKTVFIEEVRVFGAYESREVLKVDANGEIRPLKNIKFLALPSEMTRRNLIIAASDQCAFKPSFKNATLT